jgi:hypothetical protein
MAVRLILSNSRPILTPASLGISLRTAILAAGRGAIPSGKVRSDPGVHLSPLLTRSPRPAAEFLKCYASAEHPNECVGPRSDYMECLHHKKEVPFTFSLSLVPTPTAF